MKSFDQLMARIHAYRALEYEYDENLGYIVWHVGTGDNIEMLFIEAKEPGKGQGRELYRRMCRRLLLQGRRPRTCVYGHRLASNKAAERFYDKLGYTQQTLGEPLCDKFLPPTDPQAVLTLYSDEPTVVMWIKWEDLLRNLGMDYAT